MLGYFAIAAPFEAILFLAEVSRDWPTIHSTIQLSFWLIKYVYLPVKQFNWLD